MPYPHDRPACIVVPAGGERWQEMFIVQVPGRITSISESAYMNFLGERVAWMLRRSADEDHAMEVLQESLTECRLLKTKPRRSTPGLFCIDSIATNVIFLARIRLTLHEFPMAPLRGDNTAVTVLLRTGIDDWMAAMRSWAAETPAHKSRSSSQ